MLVSTDDTDRDQNSNENVHFHSLTTQGIRFHEVELKPKDEPDATEEPSESGGATRMQAKRGRGRGRPRKFVNKTAAQIGEQLEQQSSSSSVLVREENAVPEAPVSVSVSARDLAPDYDMAMEVDG